MEAELRDGDRQKKTMMNQEERGGRGGKKGSPDNATPIHLDF